MPNIFRHTKKLYAAVWGFIVGDAIGVPFEFTEREQMKENPAVDMIGFGTHHQPPGTWSDDTSMMLCVLESIANDWSTNQLADLFVKWYKDGYHTAHGELFDIGFTTEQAIERMIAGISIQDSGSNDPESAGNGSLMRSLPYAFLHPFDQSMVRIMFDGFLTHKLSICNQAILMYVKFVGLLADGLSKEDALMHSIKFVKDGWRIVDKSGSTYSFEQFNRLFDINFCNLPENDIHSSGFIIHTLESVVWSFMNSSNYEEAVLKAVNLGGDTDTIAALVGGLAGTFYGLDQIPQKWIEQIARRDDLEIMINDWIT